MKFIEVYKYGRSINLSRFESFILYFALKELENTKK